MPILTVCILVLIIAVYDVTSSRVPNKLILTGCLAAAAFAVTGRTIHPGLALAGMLLPLLFPGILFPFGMIGTGDVKLFCMIGAFLGPGRILQVISLAFAAGAVWSLVLMADYRRREALYKGFRRLSAYLASSGGAWTGEKYLEHAPKENHICFTPMIFTGLLLQILIF